MLKIALWFARPTSVLVLVLLLALEGRAQHPIHGVPADALWGTPVPAEMRPAVEYRVLPRPVKPHSHKYEPATPLPAIVSKPIQPYAYGWFGSSTSQHWSRHFGTRSSFTQWTLK